MKIKNYLFFGLLLSCIAMFLFNSCTNEGAFSDLESDSDGQIESRKFKGEPSLDCIITPSFSSFGLVLGETLTLTGNPGSTTGLIQYSWNVTDSDCIQISGSSTLPSVTVVAVGADCTSLVELTITNLTTGQISTCSVIVNVTPLSCCFEFWDVPKWFPVCFGECTGNLDHVVEIHHKPCADNILPPGFTTSIHDVQLTSPMTFGNCFNCANPISDLPNDEGGKSVNLSICGPLNHSMIIDIAIRDAAGNIVQICEGNNFSFFVPECEDGF